MATRWGIASAGKISNDFVAALSALPSSEHQVVAVAAQQLDRAKDFAKLHGIPTAYGSYEELAKDSNVDVVYVGTIHPFHHQLGKMMLGAGKPVLIEKPLTLNLKQTRELVELARSRKLFLMEAVWSRCFPAYRQLREEITSGRLGDIVQVVCNFGIPIEDVDRIKLKELGGGSILDLGIYPLQFALMALGPRLPQQVKTVGSLSAEGVDTNMATLLSYEGGQVAMLGSHARAKFPNDALVVGTKGYARVEEPFWCPTKLVTPSKTYEFPLPQITRRINFPNSEGMSYEAAEVRRCLKQGLIESPLITHKESLILAELEDRLRADIGVRYPQDDD
ncbi:trans-1,2-dihydrobenzene-1,2-diol dehydrogenase-like isoform X2 [Bacillus rossius redtenbacheri]|uniref:trans-1,2-dihydrobenzene-1,2-diol dehydrogenase-like isoform X2 n=1 Tax=Bacillus rossius redtenbacheri TaxID=93214 RepID=UPI002FDC8857